MTSTRTRRPQATLAGLAVLLLAGCGTSSTAGSATATQSPQDQTTITVYAAASLQESFTTLADSYEKEHPGTTVTLNFGPSSGLATQINQGAPVDVFASASTRTMDEVVAAGNAEGTPEVFAVNTMGIAVPPNNPAKVTSLQDLASPDTKVAVCQAQVPCGVGAEKVFGNAGITVTPVTQEADVKAVLTKVQLGEVDAGIVYVTDIKAAGDKVRAVEIPAADNATTDYPIVALKSSKDGAAAQEFIAFIRGEEGKRVLAEQGFTSP